MSEPIENIEQLKPCPHCTPEDSNPMLEVEVRGEMIFVFVTCHGCYCRGPEINTSYPILTQAAVDAWNKRSEVNS